MCSGDALVCHSVKKKKKPQRLCAARILGSTRENVKLSFTILETEIFKVKFSPNRIVNLLKPKTYFMYHEV